MCNSSHGLENCNLFNTKLSPKKKILVWQNIVLWLLISYLRSKKKRLTPLHENEPKGKRVDDDVKQQQQQ